MKRNANIAQIHGSYLFPEIRRRVDKITESKVVLRLISLGVGDTTRPIPQPIVKAMVRFVEGLGTEQGYVGYGNALGAPALRERIATRVYGGKVSPDDISICDGVKPDIGRLHQLFGPKATIAVPDPAYPVYCDSSVLAGQADGWHGHGYSRLVYCPCVPENGFTPDFSKLPRTDVIYICSPNNPTGAVMTHAQLKQVVDHARAQKSLIVFDSAYASFIQDKSLPRSIFEIPGATECAIELGSFSKFAGFSGIRLGWTVVPHDLYFEGDHAVQRDWQRLVQTLFNGPSNIAEAGGLACFTDEGWQGLQENIRYYMDNAQILRQTFEHHNLECYGGDNSPFLWVHFPGRPSWQMFEELVEQTGLISTPGAGFGPSGENFLRFSAFGSRADIKEAAERLRAFFPALL